MKRSRIAIVVAASAALIAPLAVTSSAAAHSSHGGEHRPGRHDRELRVATFNASLNRAVEGELAADLATSDDPQAAKVAAVVQRTRPDVLLINEFDYDPAAVDLFRENYLERGRDGIRYRHAYIAPSNTGVPSGFDLNNDGRVAGGDDALGFGLFPGQYGMLVLSRYPIATEQVRTFQHFLWKDLPGNRIPAGFYTDQELDVLPLSSKSHWDVPVRVGGRTIHVLASHPTPPTFDGPEDRNGRRNADEILFWRHYVSPGGAQRALVDDEGRRGGLRPGERFVIMGDMNADPLDGDSLDAAALQLLQAPRVIDPRPASRGAVLAAAAQGGDNATHRGDPRYDTADFSEPTPGNLRVDYVLPSRPLRVEDAGVFWPAPGRPGSELNDASDHHLVWVDLRVR